MSPVMVKLAAGNSGHRSERGRSAYDSRKAQDGFIARYGVVYLCYIIKNHPLTDGNKRLAVLWFEVYCEAQGLQPRQDVPLDLLAIAIEKASASMEDLLDVTYQILFQDFPVGEKLPAPCPFT
jgi:prophage maintenance system killer protein